MVPDEVEEFIYKEEEEEEEFFVFEEIGDDAAPRPGRASPGAQGARALQTGEAGAAPAAAASVEMSPTGDGPGPASRVDASTADEPSAGWRSTLEKDFFSTAPQPVQPGTMGPDEPSVEVAGTQREDDLFGRESAGPATDAVARDVLEAAPGPDGAESRPTQDGEADVSDDEELWSGDSAPVATQDRKSVV